MTPEMKVLVHLEHIIFNDLPEGTRLNAAQLDELCHNATPDQRERARARALTHAPLLLEDER